VDGRGRLLRARPTPRKGLCGFVDHLIGQCYSPDFAVHLIGERDSSMSIT